MLNTESIMTPQSPTDLLSHPISIAFAVVGLLHALQRHKERVLAKSMQPKKSTLDYRYWTTFVATLDS